MMRDQKSVSHASYSRVILVILLVTTVQLDEVLANLGLPKSSGQTRIEHVCSDIDIRNSVANFTKLENCTVIEGCLQILLIEKSEPQDFENLTFPNLREITGYFLLYRVNGLKTLRTLFPNLAVIRGSKLFHNYAFVIYEMMHLQEIGLYRLTNILRGSVRIEKNPTLCYMDTIHWDLLAPTEGHFIKDNKAADVCPNNCNNDCPEAKIGDANVKLCWNSISCQKVCDQCAGACDDGECCDEQCLGGCIGPSSRQCSACKGVVYNGKCLKECPPSYTYMYLDWRCISEKECTALNRTDLDSVNDKPLKYKPFKGKCDYECPANFTESLSNPHQCVPCNGSCPKECDGMLVDNVAAAQRLKGCTKISGALEIQIEGGKNIVRELENNLDQIEEITWYLKVVRSFPLVSLNFLRSLRTIRGEKMENGKYALYVLDNQNLQHLWDWNNRTSKLEILNGNISFHFNPKLCMKEIITLAKIINKTTFEDPDVSPTSNGDKVACDVQHMNLKILKSHHRTVVLAWDNFKKKLTDKRSLLGYVVSHKAAPYGNVTLYDGRNACGNDVWKVNDVPANSENVVMFPINHLKPFTRYAVYVRTYTIASEKSGAQSPIVYFRTEPYTPTSPQSLKAKSNSSSTLVVTWAPPMEPNGIVTYYLVTYSLEPDDQQFLEQRDYCREPMKIPDRKIDEAPREKSVFLESLNVNSSQTAQSCCPCVNDTVPLQHKEAMHKDQIEFENFLQDTVYIKYDYQKMEEDGEGKRTKREVFIHNDQPYRVIERKKRDLQSENATLTTTFASSLPSVPTSVGITPHASVNATDKSNSSMNITTFEKIVRDGHKVILEDLKHFAEYTIKVSACHENNTNSTYVPCSIESITTVRTMELDGADSLSRNDVVVQVQNNSAGTVSLKWSDPLNPNGLIVNYHIEYKRVGVEDYKPDTVCITHKRYREFGGYTLKSLGPGNYSLRLKATSLAADGEWIEPIYFFISEPTGTLSGGIIAVIVIVVALAAFAILGVGWMVFKKKMGHETPDVPIYISINPDYINAVYVLDEWEVAREKITLLKELGQGSFGMVYEGEARDVKDKSLIRCAVKTVNEKATLRERLEFLHEASVMKSFNCHHVVQLLGVVSKGQPTLVIMELMANGDLKSYLRSHRPDSEENPGIQPPTLKMILQMAIEIADGMAYLSDKKYVHRDLAARNCMVAEDLTVKIGDFGMTRDIYETDYYRKGGKGLLPVRWMAPESLKDGVFTSQCDVWSYGVVLWEMATLASQPYQGLSNEQVLKYVIDCGIMEKPENCPDKLYDLMMMCWQYQTKARPTFMQLIENLLPDACPNFNKVSYYNNRDSQASYDDVTDPTEVTTTTPLTMSEKSGRVSYGHGGLGHHLSREELEEEEAEEEGDTGIEVDLRKSPRTYKSLWPFSRDRGPTTTVSKNSKPTSTSSSDGSKDSKASGCSANGSVGNGHLRVHRLIPGGTEC